MENNHGNPTDFVPFSLPSIGIEEENAVLSVLKSGWLTTAKVALEFENSFAKKIGAKNCLAVNSATSGLILALEAIGIKPSDKVITTPYTFISTATSAVHLGAQVIYCDIEKDSYSIDPDKIEEILKTQNGVKAIIPVHVAGNPCNMKRIMQIAKKYGVYVIEDCAHAFPSNTEEGFCGTIGDIGVFSFYATKTMTTAEGGMIATNNEEFARHMKTMRLHGISRDVWDRYTSRNASFVYDVVEAGFKFNLPDVLAAIGVEQLKKSDVFFEKRKKIVDRYNAEFKGSSSFILPPDSTGNAWHLYLLGLNLENLDCDRDTFATELQEKGIGISMHFIPHFHFSVWKKLNQTKTALDFPNAENHYLRTISLPLWPDMTQEMTDKVIKAVLETGKKHER